MIAPGIGPERPANASGSGPSISRRKQPDNDTRAVLDAETGPKIAPGRPWVGRSASAAPVVVGEAFDVIFLKLTKRDFQDATRVLAHTRHSVSLPLRDEELVADTRNGRKVADSNLESIVERHPQLLPITVALLTQAVARSHRYHLDR